MLHSKFLIEILEKINVKNQLLMYAVSAGQVRKCQD